jgi:choline dehydrogenase-like flavoprotein
MTPDYLIVGGGTAGCIVAARLSEDPSVTVTLLEAGPSDADEPRAHDIRRWAEMLEGEYDLDYRSVPQERGNSNIRMARLRILGGCSTANTMISWKPLRGDLDEWVSLGAEGWTPEEVWPYWDRIQAPITPIPPQDRNSYLEDVIDAASTALGVPRRESWNDTEFSSGAGFFEIGYEPETHRRSSTSHAYIEPIIGTRANLVVETGMRVLRLVVVDGRATGVDVVDSDGVERRLEAAREVIVCCGAIDSPALLQRSGIGPAAVLEAAGVPLVLDLPGVGENLQDHAEGLVVWETREVPDDTMATGWDAGYVVTLDDANGLPDVSTHIPLETWGVHVENAGIALPPLNVSLAPNVCKPRSRGRVWVTDASPEVAPSVDYRYFTDPDGHDEATLVAGVKLARRVATAEPFASKLVREVFPGPDVTTDEDISRWARATHQTVYHVSGTCRMGADGDPAAVLDPRLRVRGIAGLRVVDASSFPTVTALNPVGTIMTLAERAAALILEDRDEDRR